MEVILIMLMPKGCCKEYKNRNAITNALHIVRDPQILDLTVWIKRENAIDWAISVGISTLPYFLISF